jgi:hypothetical protein
MTLTRPTHVTSSGRSSYASGSLGFHPARGVPQVGGQKARAAYLGTESTAPLRLHISDRMDPEPDANVPQPFYAEATEPLRVSIGPVDGDLVPVKLTFFGGTHQLKMERKGKLLVGVGPSFGRSDGGIYVIAFNGVNPTIP